MHAHKARHPGPTGAVHSQPRRMTAAAAAVTGMRICYVVPGPPQQAAGDRVNLLLDKLYGAGFDCAPIDSDAGRRQDEAVVVSVCRKEQAAGACPT